MPIEATIRFTDISTITSRTSKFVLYNTHVSVKYEQRYEQRYRSHYCCTGFELGATSVDKRKGKSKTNVQNFE